MVQYASDPTKDIHRDCAAEIFMCRPDQVSKQARYCAKNMHVFPQLYGDFYLSCAQAIWDAIPRLDIKIGDDVPAFEWLRKHGIESLGACDTSQKTVLGTFEHHMKRMEELYFRWFPVLKQKRDEFWNDYKLSGEFDLMSGFKIKGPHRRNFVLNAVVQGPAFHLLLWSLIRIVNWTIKNKTKTKIVGQIHDCILADVHKDELDDYLAVAKQVMTKDVKKNFDWVITPLDVEAELAETNWFEKKVIEI